MLLIQMRDDWRYLTEDTIRPTAARYSVKFTNLPKSLSCHKFAEWLGHNYGPVISVVVFSSDGTASSGLCPECVDYFTQVYYYKVPKAQARDPLKIFR